MIADGADRPAAEPACLRGADKRRERDCRIDDRIEEQIEVIVRERFATELGNRRQTPAVRGEHEEHRRIIDPRHLRDKRHNGLSYPGVADDDDIALLEIAFGRGREGACAKEAKQSGLDRAGQVASMRTMAGYFFQFVQPGELGINLEFGAKALEQGPIYCLRSRIIRHEPPRARCRPRPPAGKSVALFLKTPGVSIRPMSQLRHFRAIQPVVAAARTIRGTIRGGVAIIRRETAASGPSSAWQKYHSDCFFELYR